MDGSLRLSINSEMLCGGKDDSCEGNPGGVSFAFNHRFFELIKFRKSCSSVSKNFFDTLLKFFCPQKVQKNV